MSADLCRELRAVEYGIPLGRGTFYRPNPLTQKAAETIEKQAATIGELEKRIGELEAERDGSDRRWKQTLQKYREEFERAEAAEQALAAERQRREELELVVLMLEHDSGKTNEEINAAASVYVSKYLTPTPRPTPEQTP